MYSHGSLGLPFTSVFYILTKSSKNVKAQRSGKSNIGTKRIATKEGSSMVACRVNGEGRWLISQKIKGEWTLYSEPLKKMNIVEI